MQNLVIVESPAKAHTIKSYLGTGYKVVASKGHVRDLPKSTLGIDVENGFEAHYINIRGKGDLISDLKKDAKTADRIFLATDPDREGEAISWHLAAALDIPEGKSKRITFNEITKTAVKEAIRKPRDIDMDLVNAQQARRIVDRIVGYKLSPFLWKTVRSGLSAGRVQSVATRIIVEREEEIRAFVPEEYWCVDAELETPKGKTFKAAYYGSADGKKIELRNGADAERVVKATEGKPFIVADVKKGKKTKNPAPPFTTSTMQQEASRKLNFQSQRTMRVAQELYEGVNLGPALGGSQGLITYMRTDSLRVADEARDVAKQYITEKFGREFYPSRPRIYKSRSNSQDAHEAIRPSNPALDPARVREFLSADQYKLYRLIWNRFIASQMASAELSTVQTDVTCADCLFRATGYTVTFAGFMTLYEESTDDENGEKSEKIPALDKGETLKTVAVVPTQHFTEPPARYTEATLIKFLEEKGIGRPSTYTPIITIILSRGYVERDGKSLKPTPLGEVITKIMREQFPDIVDYKFTA
ncbi:MAG: type I DNA topoisomerase, partial [Clostridia bacterium]|nr:type I DNA topoisomerase [Clostridia bacterium]